MGVAEIHARIAALEAKFAPAPVSRTEAPTSHASGAGSFESLLSGALGRGGVAPPGRSTASLPPDWARGLPDAGRDWAPAITDAAERNGLDPRLVAAVAWTESGFRPGAVSGAGARGLMQLMPATAASLGVDPADPLANLDGGARYLAQQLDRFGRADLALAAYNAGPTRVARTGGVPAIPETQNYVQRVLARFSELGGDVHALRKDHR